jgi:hypothetical protein
MILGSPCVQKSCELKVTRALALILAQERHRGRLETPSDA